MKTLIVQQDGLKIRKEDRSLVVTEEGHVLTRAPIASLDGIIIMGNSQITEQALRFCAQCHLGIVHAEKNGKIVAFTYSFSEKDSSLRLTQYEAYSNQDTRLVIALDICRKKLLAQKDYLLERRILHMDDRQTFDKYINMLNCCVTINQVLGVEGQAAKLYFQLLSKFSEFSTRSRRPALDNFNTLLNLTYSMILHRICAILLAKGLDISVGFLHAFKNGRPSLGLDVLEQFRPRADAFVVNLINRREFSARDFQVDEVTGGYSLTKDAFKKYLGKFQNTFENNLAIDEACTSMIRMIRNCSTTPVTVQLPTQMQIPLALSA
jgi:CRISPR-associated protein Cas1